MTQDKTKPGPKPDRLKLEGEWEKAIAKALIRQRPAKGWPTPKKAKPRKGRSRG